MNVRWANTFSIDQDVGEFLLEKQKQGVGFSYAQMVGDNPKQTLVNLVYKEAIVPENDQLKALFTDGVKLGCSINPEDLI